MVEVRNSAQTGYLGPGREGPGALPNGESCWDATCRPPADAAAPAPRRRPAPRYTQSKGSGTRSTSIQVQTRTSRFYLHQNCVQVAGKCKQCRIYPTSTGWQKILTIRTKRHLTLIPRPFRSAPLIQTVGATIRKGPSTREFIETYPPTSITQG